LDSRADEDPAIIALMAEAPGFGPEELRVALSSVARAIAESLELTEVWERVAEACRAVVPFDVMGVSQFLPADRVRVLVAAGDPAAREFQEGVFGRNEFSPAFWPDEEEYVLVVNDAERELVLSFRVDRELVELGYRSALRLPLGRGDQKFGSLILVSRLPNRFTREHGERLMVVAEMVTLALAHEKLASAWRERRKRREALERLVSALTGTLDVSAIFEQISHIAQEIIPHDHFVLGVLSENREQVRFHARSAGENGAREELEYPFRDHEDDFPDGEYDLARDHTVLDETRVRAHLLSSDPSEPTTVDRRVHGPWRRVYVELGLRSTLRAPVRLNGVVVGGIEFGSRKPDMYGEEEAVFAVRVAEHVALALAHQQLAEESRRTAAAQARAGRLEERVQVLVQELETLSPHRALGQSRKWRDVLAEATKVAATDTTVLITGESGTGKEVIARFLHRGSKRAKGPFTALNCAALPEHLLESELFGHERGAFTGAIDARPGKIEQAAGGVLFLDEVGEMSPAVQAKFLRVLQEREFQRVGGAKTQKADVRVVAATNREPRAAIASGTFREDLYYRLGVFEIHLPPLRERPEDILVLAEAFLDEVGRTVGRPAAGISQDAREQLLVHAWPGNVRELRNAIERAVILCQGGLVTREHLPITVARPAAERVALAAPQAADFPVEGVALETVERELLQKAMTKAGNNKSQAAKLLGLSRGQLYSLLRRHGLTDARR
jgi:transcriptional regulator with GAF, ATPase, and Fis domain